MIVQLNYRYIERRLVTSEEKIVLSQGLPPTTIDIQGEYESNNNLLLFKRNTCAVMHTILKSFYYLLFSIVYFNTCLLHVLSRLYQQHSPNEAPLTWQNTLLPSPPLRCPIVATNPFRQGLALFDHGTKTSNSTPSIQIA